MYLFATFWRSFDQELNFPVQDYLKLFIHWCNLEMWLLTTYLVYNRILCSMYCRIIWIVWFLLTTYLNGDHSPNFFRQTPLLFYKWLAERFNLDDAWIVNVGYKNTSISNALITWIGKFCKFVHKQNCSHDFFLLYEL